MTGSCEVVSWRVDVNIFEKLTQAPYRFNGLLHLELKLLDLLSLGL